MAGAEEGIEFEGNVEIDDELVEVGSNVAGVKAIVVDPVPIAVKVAVGSFFAAKKLDHGGFFEVERELGVLIEAPEDAAESGDGKVARVDFDEFEGDIECFLFAAWDLGEGEKVVSLVYVVVAERGGFFPSLDGTWNIRALERVTPDTADCGPEVGIFGEVAEAIAKEGVACLKIFFFDRDTFYFRLITLAASPGGGIVCEVMTALVPVERVVGVEGGYDLEVVFKLIPFLVFKM